MIKNQDFYVVQPGIRNGSDLMYYLWIFLSLPAISIVLFTIPIHYLFKHNNLKGFPILLSVVFILEYFVYSFLASESDWRNGIYNLGIGLIVFVVVYYKYLRLRLFKND